LLQDPGCAALGQSEFDRYCHADKLHPRQPCFSSAGSAVTVSAHSSSATGAYAQQALGAKNFESCCHHAPSSVVTATTHSSSEAGMVAEEAFRSWIQRSPPCSAAAPMSPKLEMPAMAVDLPLHSSPTFGPAQQISEPLGQEPPLESKDHMVSVVSSSHAAEHQDDKVASGSATPAHQSALSSSLTTTHTTACCEPATRWMARTMLEEAAAAILPRKMASRTTSICSSLGNRSGSSAFRHRAAKDLALEFSDAVMGGPIPSSALASRRRSRATVSSQPVWGA